MVIKEAIDRVVSLTEKAADIKTYTLNGKTYSTQELALIPNQLFDEPRPETLVVHTLSGLVDSVEANLDDVGEHVLHVVTPRSVQSMSALTGDFNRRTKLIEATAAEANITWETWYDPETFIIKLQSEFVRNDDLEKVLCLVGNVRDEEVKQFADDGVTQTVSARIGVAMRENVDVPNPVSLRPFRTFREIEQPAGLFVLRAKKTDHGIKFALFEGDGGAWQLVAIQGIRDWLRERLPTMVILA